VFFYGAAYQKSQSAVFMLPEKGVPSAVVEQSVGDVGITQLDWKRVPQARSRGCKSSVAITAECWRQHASGNVSRAQRAPSAVGHETAVVGQVERRLPGQRLANQACHFELNALSNGWQMEFA